MKSDPVKILLTGDFCPINRIQKLALHENYESIFNDFINVFKGNDLNVIDLECPLTHSNSMRQKTGPHQKAHPDTIKLLNYANIKLAAMANNHIMDYGMAGLNETLSQCNSFGINTVGIGENIKKAAVPYSVEIKKKRFAFLNFADNEFLSTPDGRYTCNPLDPLNCFYSINNARRKHDFIVVIIHAGNEFYDLPSPRTKKLYRSLIDMGADVIISHHAHAFSGYEIYNSKPIFYGLGNFLYDWPGKINTSWNLGYVVKLEFSDRVNFNIIPLKQNNEFPGVFHLSEDEKSDFYNKINTLNDTIRDDKQLEIEFHKYYKSVRPQYDSFIEPYFGKIITALRRRGYFPKLMSRKKRLLLLNITRCESHREVLLRMLKEYE